MKKWTIALACLAVLAAPGAALATDLEKWEKIVGKHAPLISAKDKAVCVCLGGLFDQIAGRLQHLETTVQGKKSVYVECVIRRFNTDGSAWPGAGCTSNGGTSWLVLGK